MHGSGRSWRTIGVGALRRPAARLRCAGGAASSGRAPLGLAFALIAPCALPSSAAPPAPTRSAEAGPEAPAGKRHTIGPTAQVRVAREPLALQGGANDGLVFERTVEGRSDLWQARLSDAAVRRLFDTPDRQEALPLWSSAAKKLVYQVSRQDGERLVLHDPSDGSEILLRAEGRGFPFAAAWSPDGSHIAFAVDSPFGSNRTLREYALATGETRILGSALRHQEFLRPAYAPDGVHLVAQKRGAYIKQQLWLLERGKKARQITRPTLRSDNEASFTRDGEWIVFTSVVGNRPPGLNLIRPNGEERRGFVASSFSQEHWAAPSPTRDEIAFISNRAGGEDLFLSDIAEADLRNLSRSPRRFEKLPRWSPDGELLAVTVLDKNAPAARREPHVVVFDRKGQILLEVPGRFASWMPPWREPEADPPGGPATPDE